MQDVACAWQGIRGIGIVNAVEVVRAFPGPKGLDAFRKWLKTPDAQLLQAFNKSVAAASSAAQGGKGAGATATAAPSTGPAAAAPQGGEGTSTAAAADESTAPAATASVLAFTVSTVLRHCWSRHLAKLRAWQTQRILEHHKPDHCVALLLSGSSTMPTPTRAAGCDAEEAESEILTTFKLKHPQRAQQLGCARRFPKCCCH